MRIFDSLCIAKDLEGDNPIGLIIFLISVVDNFTISCGLFALPNSVGVISFTLLSVLWAESNTAINKVYSSL